MGNDFVRVALEYAAAELCVLPVAADGSKKPALPSWTEYQSKRPTSEELARWFERCEGYGLVCGQASGRLEVIDFDDPALFSPWATLVEAEAPGLLATLPTDQSPRGGRHVYYRCAEIGSNAKLAQGTDKTTKIETRGEGGFIVVPPTTGRYSTTGKPYTMLQGDLTRIPTITPEQRASLLDLARTFNECATVVKEAPSSPSPNAGDRPGDLFAASTTWPEILEPHGWKALRQRGEVIYWQRPGKTGPATSATTGHKGRDILFVFSSNAAPFELDTGYSKFTAYTLLNHGGDYKAATRAAVDMGYSSPRPAPAQSTPAAVDPAPETAPEATPTVDYKLAKKIANAELLAKLAVLPLTDTGNAEAFYMMHGEHFRHVRTRQDGGGYWLTWDNVRWAEAKRGEVRRATVETARARHAAAAIITDDKIRKEAQTWARTSEKRYGLAAVLDVARDYCRPLATLPEDYDRDPWLLACTNGVLDLRSGELRPGQPSDNITMGSGLPYDPQAQAPRWLRFLDEVFNGDQELIAFVQKSVGYSLSGDTREPAIFLCHGSGRNGKTTFLNIIRSVAGDYGCNTPFTTFELDQRAAIPNDVAALAGKRLVTASETSESSRLNEARIKAMTGSDPMTARFLHGEFFTYLPTFHIWLAMNHRPTVTGTDLGIWSRIKLIPFTVCFAGREDKTLEATLTTELPGILAWAVRGCLQWQSEGLQEPKAVTVATGNYREESDTFRRFVADCCAVNPEAWTLAKELREHYEAWAKESGERAGDLLKGERWAQRLRELGCKPERRFTGGKQQRVWQGLGLVTDELDALDGLDTPNHVTRESKNEPGITLNRASSASSPSSEPGSNGQGEAQPEAPAASIVVVKAEDHPIVSSIQRVRADL